MNIETLTAPAESPTDRETAEIQALRLEKKLSKLFKRGWGHLINQEWRQAEEAFAKIESYNSHYEQDNLRVDYLRQKAKFERIAESAWESGELEAALIAFKKADDFEHVQELHELLTIQELEAKAEKIIQVGGYQDAAWIYDHLLTEYPNHDKEPFWQIKKEACWEAELYPFFNLGLQALEAKKWRTAYAALLQVLLADPYFRHENRSAAALAEQARDEVVQWADKQLRKGQVHEALNAYREVGHTSRIAKVDEFLRLREREAANALMLEKEGKWLEAAAVYNYLQTLYYDEAGRAQWQANEYRCREEARLNLLYNQAKAALVGKKWREAEKLLGQIAKTRPDYQPEREPVNKLLRMARWRNLFGWLTTQSSSPSSPQVQTG